MLKDCWSICVFLLIEISGVFILSSFLVLVFFFRGALRREVNSGYLQGRRSSMRWWLSLSVDVFRKVISLNLYCRVIL
ncbi:hypothetical protein V6N13_120570 [Hibiscus sabdariffa]